MGLPLEACMSAPQIRGLIGSPMPTHLVNMDALIQREDFAAPADAPVAKTRLAAELKLTELQEKQVYYLILRKPDFQRETANWSPNQICTFVKSLLDGKPIPSVIRWRSPLTGNVFVIDGAHRLSALIAWVQNDYGDKKRSLEY